MKRKIFKILYTILIVVFVLSFYKIKSLPGANGIDAGVLKEPMQSETNRDKFSFNYRETEYEVLPQADYELRGLVVSKNNINAWFNYYHDENSVNLKDLCVVWGNNIENGVYRDKNINFKNGEWTCYWSWFGELSVPFYPNKLSNNHLLSDNEKVRKIINKVNIGDQIHLKGSLVDYREKGTEWYRMTSMSREDVNKTSRSGGACEVFFVDSINILEHNNYFWNLIYIFSLRIFFILIVIQVVIFLKKVREKTK